MAAAAADGSHPALLVTSGGAGDDTDNTASFDGDSGKDVLLDGAAKIDIIDEYEDSHGGGEPASASVPSSMINILNTILGSGMLAMPNAFASLGVVLGAIVVAIFGTASAAGLYLLAICGRKVGRASSFNAVSKITFPKAAIVFDLAIAVKCFGVACSYLVIIGNLMPKIIIDVFGVSVDSWLAQHTVWISFFMIIIVPLSFLRQLDSLKYTSAVALIAVVYLVFLVIFWFFDGSRVPVDADKIHLFNPQITFLKKLPVFVFAFTCHQNIFTTHNEMKNNTVARMNTVIFGSMLISTLTYWIVAVLGYLSFGDDVMENMLLAFPPSQWVTVARVTITILVMFSYPLQCHPCRASLDKVIHCVGDAYNARYPERAQTRYHSLGPTGSVQEDSNDGLSARILRFLSPAGTPDHQLSKTLRHIYLTIGILVVSYVITFYVTDLGLVLSLVGSTGSTTICYILPGIFYLKLTEGQSWSPLRVLAMGLLVAGCIIMPVCLTFNFVSV